MATATDTVGSQAASEELQLTQLRNQLENGFLRLRFDSAIEEQYQNTLLNSQLPRYRTLIIASLALQVGFSIFDLLFLPSALLLWALPLRLSLLCPCLILALRETYNENRVDKIPSYMIFCFVVIGIATLFIVALAHYHEYPYPYEGLIIFTLLGYLIMGVPFTSLLLCSGFIFFAYILAEILAGLNIIEIIHNSMHLLMVNVMGAIGCYLMDHAMRKNYLQSQINYYLKDASEHANQAKSRFLASASHDLRQPMHALSLFTEALLFKTNQQNDLVNQDVRDMALKISSSVEALSGLLDSLLDVSRLDAGAVKVTIEPCHLQGIFKNLHTELDEQFESMGIELVAVRNHYWIQTDKVLFARVLRNLLINAMKHANSSKVLLGAKREQGKLKVLVIDNGKGIPAQERDRIFEEYHQLNNIERDRSKGLGLGLAIVRRICQLLGLKISLHSLEGQGTCFALEVNLVNEPKQGSTFRQSFGGAPSSQGKKLVLFIDDDSAIREAMQLTFKGWGFEILTAENAEELLQKLENHALIPNLIISDFRLREGILGTDEVKKIRHFIKQDLPAIIVTGDTGESAINQIKSAGLKYVNKPINPGKLRLVMNREIGI